MMDAGTRKFFLFAQKEWEKRFKALMREATRAAAERIRGEVAAKTPRNMQGAGLKVKEVEGLPEGSAEFMVTTDDSPQDSADLADRHYQWEKNPMTKGNAVWGPATSRAARNPEFGPEGADPLLNPSSKWTPKQVQGTISSSEADELRDFQESLGIKIGS